MRLTPDDHPNRTLYLGSLATMLDDRYARPRRRLNLDAAIEAGRGAGVAISQGAAQDRPGRWAASRSR